MVHELDYSMDRGRMNVEIFHEKFFKDHLYLKHDFSETKISSNRILMTAAV